MRYFLFKFGLTLLAITVIATQFNLTQVFASPLTSLTMSLSSAKANQANTTHTINFTTNTTSTIQQIRFRYSTTIGGSSKPSGLNLTSSTLGVTTNIGSGWSIDSTNAANGYVNITVGSPVSIDASTVISVTLETITNSAIDACEPTNDTLNDTCNLKITTYSDNGSTEVDSGSTTYTVNEDPQLSFEVKSVGIGAVHNGISTTIASTSTTLPFGKLRGGDVHYLAQELVIRTNAPHGYTVSAFLPENITGNYASSIISPFGAPNATWIAPQAWQTPTGTAANSNTGWFGVNTTDTRLGGNWTSANQKFGPLSTIPKNVAYSSGPDRTGTSVFLTFALGINSIQPSDIYTGKIIYNVQASY